MENIFLIATVVFWSSLLLLFHGYVFFILSLPFLSEIFKRKQKSELNDLPKVSILISAFNEEAIIERKIANLLEIDYPKELLEILIGDDGSSDKTAEIVKRYESEEITLVQERTVNTEW
ncbi:MAG: glycosyltransferase [Fibrobacteraceae bacterium]|nr:glycosyltransferase [Fibrobacteraceae bacterium]